MATDLGLCFLIKYVVALGLAGDEEGRTTTKQKQRIKANVI